MRAWLLRGLGATFVADRGSCATVAAVLVAVQLRAPPGLSSIVTGQWRLFLSWWGLLFAPII